MTDGSDETGFESATGPGIAAGDAHDPLDVEAAFENVTVVVPTNREENYTTRSLPGWVDREVRRDEGLNVARNRGVEAADGDWIVLVDDDVTFPTRLTATIIDAMHEGQLVGLEDFWPLEWVIGRYMVFHRSLWAEVGGFDESRPHGGDTDFAVRCEKVGAPVLRLPRKSIPHHDEITDFSTSAHLEWLWYLTRRHPLRMAPKAAKLALSKLGRQPRRREYPDGWASQMNVPPEDADD
jgi:GT2 family glycosyltransferase